MSRIVYGLLSMLVFTALPSPAQSMGPTQGIEAWEGSWEGTMTNLRPGAESAGIPVQLTITSLPDGSWAFRTVYNRDEENGLRDYRLLAQDTPGHFIMDEQNGIRLHVQLIGQELVSAFRVSGRTLISRYRLATPDELVHEVTFWSEDDTLITTGEGVSGEDGAPVSSFGIEGAQRSVFRRTGADSSDG